MKPIFYDTHAHLDFPEFEGEIEQLIARAEAAGIARIMTIGTTIESSRKATEIAARFPNVFAVVGWHPSYATSAPQEITTELRALAVQPKVLAIGETGLDFSRLPSSNGGSSEEDHRYRERQKEVFQAQLSLAAELRLNVVIHQRSAFEEVMEQLGPFAGRLRAVFHCFVGTPEEQKRVEALGCLVSFTGIVTFKNAEAVRLSVRATPLEGFMLETDCPFLAPVPFRGKRCEPAYVANIAEFIAREKECSLEELSRHTCQTADNFFRRAP
ncbi:MAG TPA: TatD family hydrolase [Verrucomicrobiae bacterium]|nr:TatD family hydrolase [Verrucomicrobiae bacterium]